jgi:hypothetical protein
MSRGLGRIERAILALIDDKDAKGYPAESLAVAVYQPRKWPKRLPNKAERVAIVRAMRSLAHKYPDRMVLKGGGSRPLWLERPRRESATASATAVRHFRSEPATAYPRVARSA